jgi:cyclophilin family peptidyl-prolyl cis-trans isomerase
MNNNFNQPYKRPAKHLTEKSKPEVAARRFLMLVGIVVAAVTLVFTLFYFLSGPKPIKKIDEVEIGTKLAMEIEVNGKSFGKVFVGLFDSVVPKTAENFKQMCLSKKEGFGYAGSPFHRIVKNFVIQGGDFLKGDGTGSASIYGDTFEDENFVVPHTPGCLSMANRGKDTNGSQFFITVAPTDFLNGKHTVFGRLLDKQSFDFVKKISDMKADKDGKPAKSIIIKGCELAQ